MKKTGIFLIFIFMVSLVSAQESEKAEKLLNEVSEKVKGYDNILIDFNYTLRNPAEKVTHETRGDVSLKGEKYVLNIMGTTRMFDGKNLYTIIPEDEEVIVSAYNPKEDQNITPSKMLTFYEDGYTFSWDIVQDISGRAIQYIKLTPTNPNSELKNILLGIDRQTKHIYNLIQTHKDGSTVTITITNFKKNQPLPKTLFEFKEDRYQNYYINYLN